MGRKSGFHASSISEIGAAAGVSVANIYQYFPGKEALITALIELDLQQHHNLISCFWSTDFSRKAIEELLAEILLTHEGYAVAVLRVEIASEGAHNTHVAEHLRDSETGLIDSAHSRIRAAQSSGKISARLDPHAVTERLTFVFEGLMRLYLFFPHNGKKLIELYYHQFADTLQLRS